MHAHAIIFLHAHPYLHVCLLFQLSHIHNVMWAVVLYLINRACVCVCVCVCILVCVEEGVGVGIDIFVPSTTICYLLDLDWEIDVREILVIMRAERPHYDVLQL